MPELPEVQHAADSVAAQVVGAQIAGVTRLDHLPLLETPTPDQFFALIQGRMIAQVSRRAKWIVVSLDAGLTLTIHLRMSGSLLVVGPEVEPDRYVHLALQLTDQRQLLFHDPRKFGKVRLLDAQGFEALDESLGVEPLDTAFTPTVLVKLLAKRARAIKPLLLDQSLVAGIGNIYADEALWRAQLHPLRSAATLNSSEIEALHAGIQAALHEALHNGGSTLRNYRNGYGEAGSQQEHFNAYDRQGQPCGRCSATIVKIVVGQRGTHYCPRCQQLPSL
jgi:formamidopyrimidine-DNA glycosylase